MENKTKTNKPRKKKRQKRKQRNRVLFIVNLFRDNNEQSVENYNVVLDTYLHLIFAKSFYRENLCLNKVSLLIHRRGV